MPSSRAAALMLLVRWMAASKSANPSPSSVLPCRSIQIRTLTSQSADHPSACLAAGAATACVFIFFVEAMSAMMRPSGIAGKRLAGPGWPMGARELLTVWLKTGSGVRLGGERSFIGG